jgi:hypothetical protein
VVVEEDEDVEEAEAPPHPLVKVIRGSAVANDSSNNQVVDVLVFELVFLMVCLDCSRADVDGPENSETEDCEGSVWGLFGIVKGYG